MKGLKLPQLPQLPASWLIAGAVVGGALLYVAVKGPKNAGSSIGGAAVDFADGVVSGVVETAGELVGIPRTEKTACQLAIEEFRRLPWYQQAMQSFTVSARCSAGDYLRFVGTGKGPQDA